MSRELKLKNVATVPILPTQPTSLSSCVTLHVEMLIIKHENDSSILVVGQFLVVGVSSVMSCKNFHFLPWSASDCVMVK